MPRRASPPAAVWLTVRQIAEQLQLSDETLYTAIRAGELPAKRYGRQYRIRASDFAAWCDARPDGETAAALRPAIAATAPRRPITRLGAPIARLVDLAAIAEQRRAGAS